MADMWIWTPERTETLRKLYVEQQLGPEAIGRIMGCKASAVTHGVRRHGFTRPRLPSNGFHWSPEAVAALRRLHPDPFLSAANIARRIGGKCTARSVVVKASALGLVSPRRHKPGPRNLSCVRIERVQEEKRRYVAWFIEAGWRPSEVARLFDLRGEQVSA